MAHITEQSEKCNYTGYFDKYVTYPPKGLLPLPGKSTENDPGCDLWDEVFYAALLVNPAFNIYRSVSFPFLLNSDSKRDFNMKLPILIQHF
jgi:carboxypeptidase D